MAPIAITPALAQRNHDEVLQPYQFCRAPQRNANDRRMGVPYRSRISQCLRSGPIQLQSGLSCHRESWGRALNGERRLTEMAAFSHLPHCSSSFPGFHSRGIHRHNICTDRKLCLADTAEKVYYRSSFLATDVATRSTSARKHGFSTQLWPGSDHDGYPARSR